MPGNKGFDMLNEAPGIRRQRMFSGIWLLLMAAMVSLFSSMPLFAQSPASGKISTWHAMGAAPCVMEDQNPPSHPLRVDRTIRYLKENGFNCFVLGINGLPPYSFEDLKRLLPAAAHSGISVWAELFPPGELFPLSKQSPQAPYKTNYVKWMEVLAQLSLHDPALRGVNIDDLIHTTRSAKTFTREYICRLYAIKQQVNPALLFVPTVYELGAPEVNRLSGCVDGVWFWWTNQGTNDGMRTLLVNSELRVAGRFPIYAGVYGHATSWHKASGPAPKVFEKNLQVGCKHSNGVVIWNLPLGPGSSDNPLLAIARNFTPGGTAKLAGQCGSMGAK